MSRPQSPDCRAEQERRLDDALEQSFPASDPSSVVEPSGEARERSCATEECVAQGDALAIGQALELRRSEDAADDLVSAGLETSAMAQQDALRAP